VKRTTIITATILMLLASPALQAGGSAGLLEEASTAFSFLDFEGALQKLEQARVVAGNSKSDLVRIFALKGLCLAPLGRDAEAEQSFRAVLSLDPSYRLDPDISPRYRAPFLKVLETNVPPLSVQVTPPDRVTPGEALGIAAVVDSDPAKLVDHLLLHYRRIPASPYVTLRLELATTGTSTLAVAAADWEPGGDGAVEFYAEAFDRHGARLLTKADAEHPLQIPFIAPEQEPAAEPSAVAALQGNETAAAEVPAAGEEVIEARLEPGAVSPAKTLPAAALPSAAAAEAGQPTEQQWYEKWWVWTLIGGGAAALAATAAIVAASVDSTPDSRNFSVDIR